MQVRLQSMPLVLFTSQNSSIIAEILCLDRGLSESKVESAEEVLTLMRTAQKQRQVSETTMNKHSSRSHCIFTIRLEAERHVSDGSILEVKGKLHCVDLAGSECAKSEASGRNLERLVSLETVCCLFVLSCPKFLTVVFGLIEYQSIVTNAEKSPHNAPRKIIRKEKRTPKNSLSVSSALLFEAMHENPVVSQFSPRF